MSATGTVMVKGSGSGARGWLSSLNYYIEVALGAGVS